MQAPASRTPPAERYDKQRLLDNLTVLARIDPELAERLTWPVDDSPVRFDEAGEMRYVAHREAHDPRVPADLPELGSQELLILGLGAGDILDLALARESTQQITCWERDPWLLRLDLMRRDRRLELSSGRLRYCLGVDLLEQRNWHAAVLRHPLLSQHYTLELESYAGIKHSKRAMLCVGKLFYAQMARALAAEGFELWSLDIERQAPEELQRSVERFQPDLIVAINYSAGLAEFCAQLEKKLVVWEVDPSLSDLAPCQSSTQDTWIWTYRQANVEMYRRAGFSHVSYLALAADPELRSPRELHAAERERFAAALSFVGNSMLSELPSFRAQFLGEYAHWRGQAADDGTGAALFEQLLVSQRADFSSYSIAEELEREAPGFRSSAIARDKHGDPATMAGEFSGAEKRLSYVTQLARHGCAVWGDPGWAQLSRLGVDYRGPAAHGEELSLIYNASSINLDINRIYQPDIITMRVFDVLSCGAFVLAEHSAALEEAFVVGEELDSYRTPKELQAKVAHYLAHPESARAMAERGRERVLREHTIAARLRLMLERAGL